MPRFFYCTPYSVYVSANVVAFNSHPLALRHDRNLLKHSLGTEYVAELLTFCKTGDYGALFPH